MTQDGAVGAAMSFADVKLHQIPFRDLSVGDTTVLTVRSTGRKTVVFSPNLLPRVAILDPELTRSMPPKTTAATGFDALTHFAMDARQATAGCGFVDSQDSPRFAQA